jgi:serine/threonine protein kinase
VAWKTHVYNCDSAFINAIAIESRRKDALVTERLTSSPFVQGIYGYCGVASIVPLSHGGTLRQFLEYLGQHRYPISPLDTLIIVTQIANGMADLHEIRNTDGKSHTLAHNDLADKQFVYYDGIFQINDFNHGQFLEQQGNGNDDTVVTSNATTTCMDTVDDADYHAPEFTYHQLFRNNTFRLDQADMYKLGRILRSILKSGSKQPAASPNLEPQEEELTKMQQYQKYVIEKDMSVPPPFSDPTAKLHPGDLALVKAVQKCLFRDPAKRATAKEIADGLLESLQVISETKNATSFAFDINEENNRSIARLYIGFDFNIGQPSLQEESEGDKFLG